MLSGAQRCSFELLVMHALAIRGSYSRFKAGLLVFASVLRAASTNFRQVLARAYTILAERKFRANGRVVSAMHSQLSQAYIVDESARLGRGDDESASKRSESDASSPAKAPVS